MAKVLVKSKKFESRRGGTLSLEGINYLIFGIGILVIILGYVIMATGATYSFQSLTIAPIILLIGYLVIIPLSILYRRQSKERLPADKDK